MDISFETHQLKTFAFGYANFSYILVDKETRAALIIDPSWEYDKIYTKLNQLNLNLEAILLTHSHYDHTNQVGALIKAFNPKVFMSKAEIDFYDYKCKNLNELHDMDEVRIGNTKIVSMLTPGHTVGSMCYYAADSLFTGDTVFIEGCGACGFGGGSADSMYESIQRIKKLPTFVKVFPGHSYGKAPGYTIEYLMSNNVYFLLSERDTFVNFRTRKNQRALFRFK